MRKWAAMGGAVLVLGVIWTGTAWYTGKQLEAGLAQVIDTANRQARSMGLPMDASLSFELMSVERGVFTTQARYRVKAELPSWGAAASSERDIPFVARIDHGPFPLFRLLQGHVFPAWAAARVRLARTPMTEAWFAAAKGAAPMSAEAVASYGWEISGV